MPWSWSLLRAGGFRLDGGSMFGVVPRAIWARMTTPDERNRIELQTNCLLLDDGTTRVLVETGYGAKWTSRERDIFALESRSVLDALAEAGISPESIDHVVVTHLHFDHAGGLTHLDAADESVSSFPAADIHTQAIEWSDALANKSTMTKTYLRSHLDPIADQTRAVEGESEILPGLTVWPMPGHTWGQQAVRFDDGNGIVCFAGDVLPTVHHAGLAFSMGYDMLPYENMRSKGALLERAAREDWRLVIDHEPRDPVVRVAAGDRPGRYELIPEPPGE